MDIWCIIFTKDTDSGMGTMFISEGLISLCFNSHRGGSEKKDLNLMLYNVIYLKKIVCGRELLYCKGGIF